MFILIFILILISVYIVTFKSDFSDENLAKLTPVCAGLVFIIAVVLILTLMGLGRN